MPGLFWQYDGAGVQDFMGLIDVRRKMSGLKMQGEPLGRREAVRSRRLGYSGELRHKNGSRSSRVYNILSWTDRN